MICILQQIESGDQIKSSGLGLARGTYCGKEKVDARFRRGN
jgi:hypothetical protein